MVDGATETALAELARQVEQRAAALAVDEPPPPLDHKFAHDCLEGGQVGDGVLFAAQHQGRFCFDYMLGQWRWFDGVCWQVDTLRRAAQAVEAGVVGGYLELQAQVDKQRRDAVAADDAGPVEGLEAARKKIYKKIDYLRSVRGVENTLIMARSCPGHLGVTGEEFDRQPYLLAAVNGVIDLRSGALLQGRPEDYLSRRVNVEYRTSGPPPTRFLAALGDVCLGDMELMGALQRLLGMALIGEVREHVVIVWWGSGRNGKSWLVDLLSRVLGPVAGAIAAEMLLDTGRIRNPSAPTPELMSLRGLLLAFAAEPDAGRRAAVGRWKWLSGGDEIVGRAPHAVTECRWRPTHTTFLLTNNKPSAPADDAAFWARVVLVPFLARFVDRKPAEPHERRAAPNLAAELAEAEGPGILAWLVQGCLDYQAGGLRLPSAITGATEAYRAEQDHVADWLEDCAEVGPDYQAPTAALLSSFAAWWLENVGKNAPGPKTISQLLAGRFERGRSPGGKTRIFKGIKLKPGQEWA